MRLGARRGESGHASFWRFADDRGTLFLESQCGGARVHASGTWSSGKCSYYLPIPHDASFRLSAGSSGSFDCTQISIDMNGMPAWQSVPKGTVKTDNLTVTKVTCTVIG